MRPVIASLILLTVCVTAAQSAEVDRILAESGVTGGVVVLIGCDDPARLAAFHAGDSFVVQGLDTDPARIAAARTYFAAHKAIGPVNAAQFDGERLPYIDNLVNLLVADEPGGLTKEEILRVLAPLGTAWIEGAKYVKPWPSSMDEWPQYLHGADNNAVSRDTAVGPPRHMQWVGAPAWSRSHMSIPTVNSMVTGRGRLFTIEDKATSENPFLPARFSLVARDAFNGVVLWEHPFKDWEPVTRYVKDISVQLQRRLAAIADKVYCTPAINAPLTEFDAGTGKLLREFEGTADTQEFVYHDGVLYALVGDRQNAARYNIVKTEPSKGISTGGADSEAPFDGAGFKEAYTKEFQDLPEAHCSILALDAATGALLWKEENIVNYIGATLALQDTSAVYMTNGGLRCLEAKTGREIWRVDKHIESGDGTEANTLVISGRGVYANEGKELAAYSLTDGHERWRSPMKLNYEKAPDLFVVGGVAWTGGSGQPTSHDPETGRETVSLEQLMNGPMGHDRCYRNFITEQYFINSKTGGADFVNLRTGQEFPNHWLRGTCGMGTMPANGILYAPPYSCQCSMGAMISNFNALYTEPDLETPDQDIPVERNPRIVRGPAFGQVEGPAAAPSDWPFYRNDIARGGSTAATMPSSLKEAWKTEFRGIASAPIAVGSRVFVADSEAHTVYCLDAGNGNILWSHVAGARVDSPPAYYEGLLLFGSRDGWVTALRAADGALVWSFKDLPDKFIGAFNQLESAWPVNGSVLINNGTLYFCAGRSSFLDGGMFVYALDPRTGEVKHSAQIYGPFDSETGFPATASRVDDTPEDGFKGDIMVADAEQVYIRHKAFKLDLTESAELRPHLIPSAGFLDRTPQHRTYWTIGTGYAWTKVTGADCDILVMDGERYYGVAGFLTQRHSYFDPRLSGYKLTSAPLPSGNETNAIAEKGARRTKNKAENGAADEAATWNANIPLTGKAMVKAGDTLCIAGTPMAFPKTAFQMYVDSYEQRLGGILWLASAEDGSKLAEYTLDAAPVWDGMAAAGGKLFIALNDGSLRCFSAE